METRQAVCEIVEVGEGIEARSRRMLKQKQVYSVEDDIDKLFQAIDIRPVREESLWKNRMKRPMRASTSHTSVSNSSNLKQALRGLCILQASEMAAMKRQSLKLAALSKDKMVNKSRMLDTEQKGKQKANVKVHALAKEITEIPSNSVKTSLTENVSSEISSDITNTAKSTTSISEESSTLSGSSRGGNRPHMSKDLRWDAIREIVAREGSLNLKHFKLHRRLGSGDIGSVYLAQLLNTDCLFALKVMDNEFLARRKKLSRAETEREILQMLDHPFLPTLYAHFSTDRLSCLVMEYCPGGDLHVVRQKQPARIFSEQAARFYVAEVVLAIEYLHMLGVIYRDLKPENILVREDGHIMLSDFDLSLRCTVNPTILISTSPGADPQRKTNTCNESSCIDPFCLQPTFEASCFTPKLLLTKTRNPKPENNSVTTSFPQLVVEPTEARSNSFVGTHEYLAPEIIKGDGHGSAVDWWTLGVFLYELLYGKTPFKGLSNEETVSNVMTKAVRLPESQIVSFYGRDLIRGLLVKEPGNRLGFAKGAVEIKQHPFFEGLNWALIRCAIPPERPQFEKGECQGSDRVGFDLF